MVRISVMMRLEDTKKLMDALFAEVRKVIVGQDEMIHQMTVALLTNSHALLEGYPGLAKTLAVRTVSEVLDLKFSRIQNTPDLMPSDITGTYIIEETSGGKRQFKFQPGPIFANIVLADEINRATPKTQSAMLEAMQEKQVTVGNSTFKLEEPFFVLATMNPIEQEGSLALDEPVFVNGELKTGSELLAAVEDRCIAENKKGTKLYDIDAWTLSLNTSGKLEKQKCLLYTLPYQDEFIVLTTRTGRKLKVTKNHPFLVNENGIILWKKAEELTKQDYVINPARLPVVEQKNIVSHEEAIALMSQMPLPNDIPFDEDFAFWIAFLLSDGAIGEKYVEAVQKNYPEALDRFVAISKKYGFCPSVFTNRGCRYARIYSKPLVEYLHIRFGVTGGKDKEIPSWFLSFPAKLNKEFLRTFISLESSLRDNRIVFTQKSVRNVNVIMHMLLREGILSWPRHDGRIFRLKIQGEDFIRFLKQIGWVSQERIQKIGLHRKTRSSFRVVPVLRRVILKLVERLGINSFHTLKGRQSITSRPWYGSYKGIKEGEVVMSVDALREFVKDIKKELETRKLPNFFETLKSNPRQFAAKIGVPMTDITEHLRISRNQVWSLYDSGNPSHGGQITQFLQGQHTQCIQEAEQQLKYCEALLSEDIYYDQITSLECVPSNGMAFGLTVPKLQNYIAGFGGCGINHNTYPLPEAQADRFLLKIRAGYPNAEDELKIVDLYAEELKKQPLRKVLNAESLLYLQKLTRQVPVATDIKKYAVGIITATRNKKDLIEYGASPRASIGLVLAAKARALMEGRKYVSKDDINKMAYPILRHRIILSFEAERQNLHEDDVIKQLLK
ncbi:AAA family ATPase [Candidatus Woesearchaeota archaeon]|nr:AAA family ATPase [Candidatus Woesearchaeota archaeon]